MPESNREEIKKNLSSKATLVAMTKAIKPYYKTVSFYYRKHPFSCPVLGLHKESVLPSLFILPKTLLTI
jgi:hypothetical protein